MARFVCLSLLLCLTACNLPTDQSSVAEAAQVSAGSGRPEPVRLWTDASIFQLVGNLIRTAKKRVLVEVYEIGRQDLIDSLAAARARGLDVRVITDPTVVASRKAASALDRLGVAERVYPVDDAVYQIDHVKLLIADAVAAVGGMNWGQHSDPNHDYVLETRITSELLRLTQIFEQDWSLAGGEPRPLKAARSAIAQTAPGQEIRAMLEAAFSAVKRRVWAEAYTLTDPAVIAALADAHRRGASVRVLLDPSQAYNRHAFDLLHDAGVEVRWYPVPRGTLLHAKVGLFDGTLVLGSANWTLSGLDSNHELDIETDDPNAVETYASRFAVDWAAAA